MIFHFLWNGNRLIQNGNYFLLAAFGNGKFFDHIFRSRRIRRKNDQEYLAAVDVIDNLFAPGISGDNIALIDPDVETLTFESGF